MIYIKRCLFVAVLLIGAMVPFSSKAQTDVDLDTEFGGRLSLELDKKISRGLHLSLEEEIRMDDNFKDFDRLHTSVALKYKVNPYLKVGGGYALIAPYSAKKNSFKSVRHRLMADATGSVRFGMWTVSLKERFQWTYRTGDMNTHQSPRNLLGLKSRLEVKYKRFKNVTPYLYVETRHLLNAYAVSALYDESNDGYYTLDGSASGDCEWYISGHQMYLNRFRESFGVDYRINKRNSLNVSVLIDHVSDKKIDANSEGTELKSYTNEKGFIGWICCGYSLSL